MKYICIKDWQFPEEMKIIWVSAQSDYKSNNLVKGEVYDVSPYLDISPMMYDISYNGRFNIYLGEDELGEYLMEIQDYRDNQIKKILAD